MTFISLTLILYGHIITLYIISNVLIFGVIIFLIRIKILNTLKKSTTRHIIREYEVCIYHFWSCDIINHVQYNVFISYRNNIWIYKRHRSYSNDRK